MQYQPVANGRVLDIVRLNHPGEQANVDFEISSQQRIDLLGTLPCSSQNLSPFNQEDGTLDLELMHHYCTVTCNTLTLREDARHVWRVIIPIEGYSNKYVMHGLLAIGALHRAFLCRNPPQKERYVKASAYHLTTGLKEFREIIAAPIDPCNWQPVFCFSSMISLHLMGSPIRLGVNRWPAPIINLAEVLASVKGFQAILEPFLGSLGRTQLAPLSNSVWLENSVPISR